VRPPGPFPEPRERLHQLAREHGLHVGDVHLDGIPGMEKMSEVISEWAAPILEPFEDAPLATFRNALSTAALIWNAATNPEGTTAEVAAQVLADLRTAGGPVPDALIPSIELLVESRRLDYSADRRIVMAAEAVDVGDDRRIRVTSAMP